MRTTHSFIVALLAACSALLHAAPSFASDATAAPGDRVLAMATVVAIALLLLGLGLYCEVASLRPLVRRTGVEARAREDDPTHVLSRAALQQAMAGAGDSQAPRAAMSRSAPAPEPRDAGRRPQVFQRRSPQ